MLDDLTREFRAWYIYLLYLCLIACSDALPLTLVMIIPLWNRDHDPSIPLLPVLIDELAVPSSPRPLVHPQSTY